MTTKFLQFTLLISLLIVYSANTHAQKFLNKGDLKPVIDNIFIWHATHSVADIDRSGNPAMGTGTFNDHPVSGAETNNDTEGTEDTANNNDSTGNETSDDATPIGGNNDSSGDTNDDNSSTPINTGGLLSDNPLPSRGDEGNDNTTDGTGTTDSDETTNNNNTNTNGNSDISIEGILGDKGDNILDQIVSYPNPANEQINILIPLMDDVVRVRLISLSGQSVINRTVHGNSRMTLDTYHLSEGVYLLEFTSSKKQIYRRTYIKR